MYYVLLRDGFIPLAALIQLKHPLQVPWRPAREISSRSCETQNNPDENTRGVFTIFGCDLQLQSKDHVVHCIATVIWSYVSAY